jgi:hypothetical protein
MTERLIKFFGKDYTKPERTALYDYIEDYIAGKVAVWTKSPDTDAIAASFSSDIKQLDNSDFSFLLLTTGYIPEFYGHDSSQETLYSKLVEVLVCEWAIRIGFTDSSILKQKASKEDVSIKLGNLIIVCDAKTFRLGRSQPAPNVKDTIKKADYDKWQDSYRGEKDKDGTFYSTIGGLITFPSLHRWKGGSDAYLYCTDKDDPIAILFYEYLAYMILGGFGHERLIDVLSNYPELFPAKRKEQHLYFNPVLDRIFGENNEDFTDFIKLSLELINELVAHKTELVTEYIAKSKKLVEDEVERIPIEDLKRRLIEAETKILSNQLQKQLDNINKFRVKKGSADKKENEISSEIESESEG